MAEQIVAAAKAQGLWIAVAESLTGGALCQRLVRVPGASEVLLGAVVAYQDQIKSSLLGVSRSLIANQSAVDAEVAAQMASGVRDKFAEAQGLATSKLIGIATTGIAGPATVSGKEPGEVFIALCSQTGTRVYQEQFTGSREEIIEATVARAIEILGEDLGL